MVKLKYFVFLILALFCLKSQSASTVELKPSVEAWIDGMPTPDEKRIQRNGLPLIVMIDLGAKDFVLKRATLSYEGKRWSPSKIEKQDGKFRIDGNTQWTAGSNLGIELFILDPTTKKEIRVEASTTLRRTD